MSIIENFLTGCYAPSSTILMADNTKKALHSLSPDDKVLSLRSDGILIENRIKSVHWGEDYLYDVSFGHDNRIITITANQKLKTKRGITRTDHLEIDNDLIYSYQENGNFQWLSLSEKKPFSPKKESVICIRTYEFNNVIINDVVSYNYSHLRQIREWIDRNLTGFDNFYERLAG